MCVGGGGVGCVGVGGCRWVGGWGGVGGKGNIKGVQGDIRGCKVVQAACGSVDIAPRRLGRT